MAMSSFDSSNSKVGDSGGNMKKVVINKCWSQVTAVAKWLVVCDNCIISTNSSLREFSLSEYLMLNTSRTARDIVQSTLYNCTPLGTGYKRAFREGVHLLNYE